MSEKKIRCECETSLSDICTMPELALVYEEIEKGQELIWHVWVAIQAAMKAEYIN